MIDTELYSIVVDTPPTAQELDITHTKRDRLAPSACVGECEHERPMLPRLGRQPSDVIDREIYTPLSGLVGQVLHVAARVRCQPPSLHRVIKDAGEHPVGPHHGGCPRGLTHGGDPFFDGGTVDICDSGGCPCRFDVDAPR